MCTPSFKGIFFGNDGEMSKSQMKRSFAAMKEPGQTFADCCQQEIKTCCEQLAYAVENAAKDIYGKPLFFTILRHCARSGMIRTISVHYCDTKRERMLHLNYVAAVLLGRCLDRNREGVVCHGCGMDMGFELVYALSDAASGDGYAVSHQWL